MLLPEQNNMYENHPTLYNVYTYTIPMLGRGFLIHFGKHAKKKEKKRKKKKICIKLTTYLVGLH